MRPPESADFPLEEQSGDPASRPKCYRCHVTSIHQLWGVARNKEAMLKGQGQRKGSLPFTGPMYIISEAGMERDRARKRKTGKVEGRKEMGRIQIKGTDLRHRKVYRHDGNQRRTDNS